MLFLSLIIGGLIIFAGFVEASWNIVKIGTCPTASLEGVEVANGRNDSKNRIYSQDRMGPLYEFTWTGSSFSSSVINLPASWQ